MNYLIDIGEIFQSLKQESGSLSPEVIKEVKEALHCTLSNFGELTIIDDEQYREKFLRDYRLDMEKAKNEAFDLVEYLPKWKAGKVVGYMEFGDECFLFRGSEYFDLFFALKLYFIKPMMIQEFLHYQLQYSFEGNKRDFDQYLQQLFIVYPFLGAQNKALTELFLASLKVAHKEDETGKNEIEDRQQLIDEKLKAQSDILKGKDEKLGTKEFTLPRQFLAIYFLLRALGIYDKQGKPTNKAAMPIAELVQLLTGKNIDNIRKLIANPLINYDNNTESDLRFVRYYFKRLNMDSIVTDIDKELGK